MNVSFQMNKYLNVSLLANVLYNTDIESSGDTGINPKELQIKQLFGVGLTITLGNEKEEKK